MEVIAIFISRIQPIFLNVARAAETSFDLKAYNAFGECDNILCVVGGIIRLVRIIATPLVVLVVLYGAFLILTAGAKPDNLKRGREVIWYAIIGYVLVLAAGGLTILIQSLVTP
jgi:hypothetical protein